MTNSNQKTMTRTPSQRAGNSRLSAPMYRLGVMVLLLIVLGIPVSAVAQCPGTTVSVGGSSAIRSAQTTMMSAASWPASIASCFNMPGATMVYFGVGTGMTPATSCQFSILPNAPMAVYFGAFWPGAAPAASNGGCQFTCPNTAGGTCQVLSGTGLPVELMEFSVEDHGASSD